MKTLAKIVVAVLAGTASAGALAAQITIGGDSTWAWALRPAQGLAETWVPLRARMPGQAQTWALALALLWREGLWPHSETTQAEIYAIANLQNDSVVRVVMVDSVSATSQAFAEAQAESQEDISLGCRLRSRPTSDFKAQLEASDVEVTWIVAAEFAADGALVLYSSA